MAGPKDELWTRSVVTVCDDKVDATFEGVGVDAEYYPTLSALWP